MLRASNITGGTINNTALGGASPAAAVVTNLTATGTVSLKGTTTNDNASVGNIGEMLSSTISSGAPVTLSNGSGSNIVSFSLTPGDWDINGQANFVLSGVTGTLFQSGISFVSASLPTQLGGSGLGTDPLMSVPLATTVLSSTYNQQTGPVRASVTTTTPVYLVAQSNFSIGTLTAYGTLRARRIR